MTYNELIMSFIEDGKLAYLHSAEINKIRHQKKKKLPKGYNIHHIKHKQYGGGKNKENLLPLKKTHHQRVHILDIQHQIHHERIGVKLIRDDNYNKNLILDTLLGENDKVYKSVIKSILNGGYQSVNFRKGKGR